MNFQLSQPRLLVGYKNKPKLAKPQKNGDFQNDIQNSFSGSLLEKVCLFIYLFLHSVSSVSIWG